MSFDAPLDNPFDPSEPNLQPETWSLDAVMRQATFTMAHELRVCVPARVVAVNGEQNVDLQPLLKTRRSDGTVEAMPMLRSALVMMPMGNDWSLKFPLAVGDIGLALFCDRSLDAWAVGQGEATDPADDRCHDLSDALFIPGLVPVPKQSKDGTQDLVLKNGSTVMRLKKDGRVTFSNGQNELVDLLSQLIAAQSTLIDELTASIVLTSFGPAQFAATTLAKFAQVKATTQAIATKTDTLKGTS